MRSAAQTNIGDTEERAIARTKAASDKLLALLKLVHSDEVVEEPPPVPAPAPPKQKHWFKIVRDVDRKEPGKILIGCIQDTVAYHYGVTKLDIISDRRTANVVRPRQVAMYLARTLTVNSMPEIGRRFGKRDHTTVIHAYRKIERLRQTDHELAARIETIKAELRA